MAFNTSPPQLDLPSLAPEKVPNSPQPTPQALAASLKQNKILKKLWLEGNDLGDLGAEAPLPKPPEGDGVWGEVFGRESGVELLGIL